MDLRGQFLIDARLQLLQQMYVELEPLCAVLGWSFGRLHKYMYLHILLCALSYRVNRTVNKSSVESCHVQNEFWTELTSRKLARASHLQFD